MGVAKGRAAFPRLRSRRGLMRGTPGTHPGPSGTPPGTPSGVTELTPGYAALPGPGGGTQTPGAELWGAALRPLRARRSRRLQGGGGGGGRGRSRKGESLEQKVQEKLREFFTIPRLLVQALSLFLIELVQFLGESVVQVLLGGLLRAISEQILTPVLVLTFESLLQPLLLFLLRILCASRDLLEPPLEILGRVCAQGALLLGALRLVEINLQRGPRAEPRG